MRTVDLLSAMYVERVVLSCRALFVRAHPEPRALAICALINFAKRFPYVYSYISYFVKRGSKRSCVYALTVKHVQPFLAPILFP